MYCRNQFGSASAFYQPAKVWNITGLNQRFDDAVGRAIYTDNKQLLFSPIVVKCHIISPLQGLGLVEPGKHIDVC